MKKLTKRAIIAISLSLLIVHIIRYCFYNVELITFVLGAGSMTLLIIAMLLSKEGK
jgi:hypothetical protein